MNSIRNVGSIDKIIRLIVGITLSVWGFFFAGIGTTVGIIAGIVGVVLILTGLLNFCPLFKVLGISSFRRSTN